jgi:hypothetical protein
MCQCGGRIPDGKYVGSGVTSSAVPSGIPQREKPRIEVYSGHPGQLERHSRYTSLIKVADHKTEPSGDWALLRERAAARYVAPATYASTLIGAHVRVVKSALPKRELDALRQSKAQLKKGSRKYTESG